MFFMHDEKNKGKKESLVDFFYLGLFVVLLKKKRIS